MTARNEKARNDLLELLGQESMTDIEEWFSGMSYTDILDELNSCWPFDYNSNLASDIYDILNPA